MERLLDYTKRFRKEIFFVAYFLLALNIVYVIYTDYSDRKVANIKKEGYLVNLLVKIKASNGMVEDKNYKKALQNLEDFKGRSLTEDELIDINIQAQNYERQETEN